MRGLAGQHRLCPVSRLEKTRSWRPVPWFPKTCPQIPSWPAYLQKWSKNCDKKLEVRLEPVEGEEINNKIDDAYREKYDGSQYLPPMISEQAREATVNILPRGKQVAE